MSYRVAIFVVKMPDCYEVHVRADERLVRVLEADTRLEAEAMVDDIVKMGVEMGGTAYEPLPLDEGHAGDGIIG